MSYVYIYILYTHHYIINSFVTVKGHNCRFSWTTSNLAYHQIEITCGTNMNQSPLSASPIPSPTTLKCHSGILILYIYIVYYIDIATITLDNLKTSQAIDKPC